MRGHTCTVLCQVIVVCDMTRKWSIWALLDDFNQSKSPAQNKPDFEGGRGSF